MSLRFVITFFSLQQSSLSEEHSDQPGLWSDPLRCLPGKHGDFIFSCSNLNFGRKSFGGNVHEESDEPLKSVGSSLPFHT